MPGPSTPSDVLLFVDRCIYFAIPGALRSLLRSQIVSAERLFK
jgi:hypothetical protein